MGIEVLVKDEDVARLARKILTGMATGEDLRAAKPEDVRAIKCDTGEVHYRAVAAKALKVKGEGSERRRKFVASKESRDRMGDVIKVSGWDFKPFRENPQALWAHQDRGLPIGLVTDIEKGEHRGIPTLWETIDYHSAELNPQAEAIFRLVEAGAIRAVSVGFLPTKTVWPQSTEERDAMDLGPFGVCYEKQEQLELSNCTVPAHSAALASKMVRKALVDLVDEGKLAKDVAGAMLEDIARLRKKRAAWFGYRAAIAEEERLPVTEAAEDATEVPAVDPTEEATEGDGEAVSVPDVECTVTETPSGPDEKTLADCTAKANPTLGLAPGDYRWDGKRFKAIEPIVTTLEAKDAGPTPVEKLILEKIDALVDATEELAKAHEATVDEMSSLQGVLRSSSRSADATKFYGEVFRTAQQSLRPN
jgi:hypothetical protein